jgi:hypothetical protein
VPKVHRDETRVSHVAGPLSLCWCEQVQGGFSAILILFGMHLTAHLLEETGAFVEQRPQYWPEQHVFKKA